MYAMDHTAHFEHRTTPQRVDRLATRLAARARAALGADTEPPEDREPVPRS